MAGPTGPQQCVSGVYHQTPPSLADGQQAPLQLDVNGQVKIAGTISATNPSVGPNGSPIPSESTLIATEDSSGNLQPVSATNPVPITGTISATSAVNCAASLPTLSPGSQAPQASLAGATYVQAVFGSASGGGTQVDGTHGLPVAGVGDFTVVQSTGADLQMDATNFPVTVDTDAGAAGTDTIRVVLATGGATIPVSGTVTAANASVSATGSAVPASATYGGMSVSGNLVGLTGTANGLKVDGSAVTQPISASALPLPTGAATSALQTSVGATAHTDAAAINTTLGTPFQAGGSIGNTTFASTQSGAWNITNITGTVSLPTGAATSANQPTNAAQGSTTSGQTGMLIEGAVTTASPTYSTGQTNPLSLDTSGNLRVNVVAGGAGGGAVFGPTAVGSAAANPPILLGGTANATATGNVEVAKVDSSGNLYTQTQLLAGSAAIGSITNTSFAVTNAGTFAVQAAQSGTWLANTAADGATGSAVPSDGNYQGLLAATALPGATTAGDLVGQLSDKFGRSITRSSPRELLTTVAISTTSTSGTLLSAQGSGVFADPYRLVIANSSAAAVLVSILDGTNTYAFEVPANGTVGFSGSAADATPAASTNTAWTYTVASNTTTIYISAQFILNK